MKLLLEKVRDWLLSSLFSKIKDLAGQIGRLHTQMTMTSTEVRRLREKLHEENSRLNIKYAELKAHSEALEIAGVRRKFGGTIDIDYDKFLNALGPFDEKELKRVIEDRAKKSEQETIS